MKLLTVSLGIQQIKNQVSTISINLRISCGVNPFDWNFSVTPSMSQLPLLLWTLLSHTRRVGHELGYDRNVTHKTHTQFAPRLALA